MFWPAFGWHGAGLGCFCLVSGWCETVPDAIWLVPQWVDGNRLFFGWRDAGGWRLRRLPARHGQTLDALVASRLDFHFLSGWRDESFEDQTH